MAGFELIKSDADHGMEEVPISSLTLAVGDLLMLEVGATTWTEATSSTEAWQRKFVVRKATTTADTLAKGYLVQDDMVFLAELANASAAAHNGDRMVLTDKNTLNNTGTDNTGQTAVAIQITNVGDAADNRATVRIVAGDGINPDAA